MNKPFNRSLKVITITLLTVLIFIVLLSLTISLFYEKAVVRYMKNYLDEHLLTQLSMDEIRFKVLKGFPNATVEIKNAVLLSGEDFSRKDFQGSFADTLLHARSVFLQFNLMKFFNKDYELKKIVIDEGKLNILIDSRKRHNLKIWRSSADSGRKYSIHLRSIGINSTQVNVISVRQQFALFAWSDKTNFHGDFKSNILSGETKGVFKLRQLSIKNRDLLKNTALQFNLDMNYGQNILKISQGKVHLNKALFLIKGEYLAGKKNAVDLTINMPKFKFDDIMSIVPREFRFSTGKYSFDGNGSLNMTVLGSLSDLNRLLIRSSFELNNGGVKNINTKETVSNLIMQGSLSGTNKTNFKLTIDTLQATLGKGNVSGSMTLENLSLLFFNSRIHALLDLKALKEFTELNNIEYIDGTLQTDFISSGNLKKLHGDSSALALNYLKTGTFQFNDVRIKLKNFPVSVDAISGKATLNNSIRIDSISLKINETFLILKGNIRNLSQYLMHRGILTSSLEIYTPKLDISKYLNQPSNKGSQSGFKSLSIFPSNIYLKSYVHAGDFIAGKFQASNLIFNMSALNDSVYLDDISLLFPDGKITGNALITLDALRTLSLTCNATPEKVNIQQLFYAFNNFGQHFIMDKNMKGQLAGKVSFYAKWDSTLRLFPQSMKAKGEFEISNGELLEFEPMLKLSKYIDVEELRHIRFKTLNNTVFINERQVIIPEMAINSSAFNISASGQHGFDNLFDYRVNVLLSEVLFNKTRKKKKEIDEFLIEENIADQTTIPLIIAGKPDKFDVKLDKKKAFSLTRNKMKNDKSVKALAPPPDNFKIDWDEPEKIPDTKSDKVKKESDFVIEWEE